MLIELTIIKFKVQSAKSVLSDGNNDSIIGKLEDISEEPFNWFVQMSIKSV
jgi:hypothetical protein